MSDLLVSRLSDGRILWLRRSAEGGPVVLEGSTWAPAEGVTFGMGTDSKPLRAEEIDDLVSRGILPR